MSTNIPSPENLLNEKQAAEILGLSPRTLQKWRVIGGGPGFCKLLGAVRYSRADLNEFVERSRRRSTSDTATVV